MHAKSKALCSLASVYVVAGIDVGTIYQIHALAAASAAAAARCVYACVCVCT